MPEALAVAITFSCLEEASRPLNISGSLDSRWWKGPEGYSRCPGEALPLLPSPSEPQHVLLTGAQSSLWELGLRAFSSAFLRDV